MTFLDFKPLAVHISLFISWQFSLKPDLIIYLLFRWCSLEKYNRLLNVTVLVLENVSLYHYEAFESHFPFTSSSFDHKLEIISPFAYNSDFVKELSMVPLTCKNVLFQTKNYGRKKTVILQPLK